jgi:hypothetical protein
VDEKHQGAAGLMTEEEERFERSAQLMVDYGIYTTIEEARKQLKASLKRVGKEEQNASRTF